METIKQHEPPQRICFTKQQRHCSGDIIDQDLMDGIYNAVQTQRQKGVLLNPDKNPKAPYVSI
jgi:hypothetical protein